jgi:hypothetical protein
VILKCHCQHEFQDSKYGKGMRVHTPTKKSPEGSIFRCTICKTEKNASSGEVAKQKKK